MNEKVIGVVGAGSMGRGIAQAFLQNGFNVIINDQNKDVLKSAQKYIFEGLNKLVELEKILKNQKEEFEENLKVALNIKELSNCTILIEAINEELDLKGRLLKQLDNLINKNSIIATNTSTISINKIAKYTKNPNRIIGLHFFIPAEIMKLVEVIPGKETSLDTINKSVDLIKSIKKIPVKCKDSPGFIVNRLSLLFQNEAAKLLDEKIASVEDIDNAVKFGLNHRMGPLELADIIGLDILYNSLMILHNEIGAEKYRPAKTLCRLIEKGKLGKKTREGFYKYTRNEKRIFNI